MFFNPNSFRTVLCIRRKLACSNFSDNKKSRKEKGKCFKFTCVLNLNNQTVFLVAYIK